MARIEKTVFICYRRKNFAWAWAISQELSHNGFDVFLDFEQLRSGDFEAVILESIRTRAHFVILLAPSTLERCSDPEDLLRREIEEAMMRQRNIVPVFLEGFDMGVPAIAQYLTGSLSALKRYQGMTVPAEYSPKAMERLREFLDVPLEAVLHPPSIVAQVAAKEQQVAASTDALTGLLNRREFQGYLEHALRRVREWDGSYAYCQVDIDDFKSVNDKWGHAVGDRFLVEISALLKSKIRNQDILSRVGGDEFGILFEGSLSEAMHTAQTLSQSLREFSFTLKGHTFSRGANSFKLLRHACLEC